MTNYGYDVLTIAIRTWPRSSLNTVICISNTRAKEHSGCRTWSQSRFSKLNLLQIQTSLISDEVLTRKHLKSNRRVTWHNVSATTISRPASQIKKTEDPKQIYLGQKTNVATPCCLSGEIKHNRMCKCQTITGVWTSFFNYLMCDATWELDCRTLTATWYTAGRSVTYITNIAVRSKSWISSPQLWCCLKCYNQSSPFLWEPLSSKILHMTTKSPWKKWS